MKKIIQLTTIIAIALGVISCDSPSKKDETKSEQKTETVKLDKPTDAEFLSFMVYHHMNYMIKTANAAGSRGVFAVTGTRHTEGTDAVVTPALDHIYTKAVIDLTEGPVTVVFPEVEEGRYYSIHITDEELCT